MTATYAAGSYGTGRGTKTTLALANFSCVRHDAIADRRASRPTALIADHLAAT